MVTRPVVDERPIDAARVIALYDVPQPLPVIVVLHQNGAIVDVNDEISALVELDVLRGRRGSNDAKHAFLRLQTRRWMESHHSGLRHAGRQLGYLGGDGGDVGAPNHVHQIHLSPEGFHLLGRGVGHNRAHAWRAGNPLGAIDPVLE